MSLFDLKSKDVIQKEVIRLLCQYRSRMAFKRSEAHHYAEITDNTKYKNKTCTIEVGSIEEELLRILPSRSKWKSPGKERRFHTDGDGYKRKKTSVDLNTIACRNTVHHGLKNSINENWRSRLEEFIDSVYQALNSEDYVFEKPKVIPLLKDKDNQEYRAICQFGLRDKVVQSILNKYLNGILDPFFLECSYAFRVPSRDSHGSTHHNAFHCIKEFIGAHVHNELYVAECDIQKFYDTLSHDVILVSLNRILEKNGLYLDKSVHHLFRSYLDSFSYYHDVFAIKDELLSEVRIKHQNADIKWVRDSLYEKYYSEEDLKKTRIGVPQGGALSGLIANIVLNDVDTVIMALKSKNEIYLRYCDDIIIIGSNLENVRFLHQTYEKMLETKKLPYHNSKDIEHRKEYYNGKSIKATEFTDDCTKMNSLSWIGFVGYEINRRGHIRVRKKSFAKEMDKILMIRNKYLSLIKHDIMRVNANSIISTLKRKYAAMSVGYVPLWALDKSYREMSWGGGFKMINANPTTIKQLRNLDNCRNKAISIITIKYGLRKIEHEELRDKKKGKYTVDFMGYPFSYQSLADYPKKIRKKC